MPKLLIIYDLNDKVSGFKPEDAKRIGIKEASLSINEDLENTDIYALARKLAELLLEQL